MYNAVIDDIEQCYGCGICVEVCPKRCLSFGEDAYGFRVIKFDDSNDCISCGKCKKVCPRLNNEKNNSYPIGRFYAQNKEQSILEESSSGGAFSALANVILEHGGVVWGVAMNPDGTTEFQCVSSAENLSKLRGSKYVEICKPIPFEELRLQLRQGIQVLFSGTPCQTKALHLYLQKESYSNLYIIDLLCYGIQSPYMWEKYMEEVNKDGLGIKHIAMRNKKPSWECYSMEIEFNDGSKYKKSRWKDPYLLTYSTNIFNRPTCSNCDAKSFPRVSDLTIGDFWQIDGLQKIPKDIEIGRGVSIILTNSQKGYELLKQASRYMTLHRIPDDTMPQLISRFQSLSKRRTDRGSFREEVENLGFSRAVKRLPQSTLKKRCRFIWLAIKRNIRKRFNR